MIHRKHSAAHVATVIATMRLGVLAIGALICTAGNANAQGDETLPEFAIARLGTLRFRLNLRFGSGAAAVGFSPDTSTVLATCDMGLGIWDAATGKPAEWPVAKNLVRAAAFTPDGKTLVTYSRLDMPARFGMPEKRLIQHWQAGVDRPVRQFEIEVRRAPTSTELLSITPDAKLLAQINGDEIVVWDCLTGKVHARVKEKLNHWAPFALSPDGKTLVVIPEPQRDKENGLLIYDLPAAKLRCRISRDGYSPTISPDGKFLVTATADSLCVWDAATGDLTREIPKVRGRVAFSADGKLMACGDRAGVQLFSWPDCKAIRRFDELNGGLGVYALAFSADGKRLATGHDQIVAVWDVATGKQAPPPSGHQAPLCALAFSADGKRLASGSDGDGLACVWDLAKRQERTRLTGHARAAASVAFSPDGKTLACGDGSPTYQTGGGETHIHLWNLDTAKRIRKFPAHLNGVANLDFAPDGKTLASGGLDARVRLWNVADGVRLAQVRGGDGHHWARFSPDGKSLLIVDGSGEISLWQADMKQKLRDLLPYADQRNFVEMAAFSHDGKSVTAGISSRGGKSSGTFLRWDTASGKSSPADLGALPVLRASAFSPDGRLFAAAVGGDIHLWDVDSRSMRARLQTGNRYLNVLAFSPDGEVLASGGWDTTILLWDVKQAPKKPGPPK